jgi:acyl carrier protein
MCSVKSPPPEEEQIKGILGKLRPMVAKVLRISEEALIDDKPLIHYGVSSLMSLVLLQKINKNFGIKFSLEEISLAQSVDALKQLILTKLTENPGDFSE